MRKLFRELRQHRYLLFMLTVKAIKIKYKQAIMGFGWALLTPLLIVATGLIVKKAFSIMSGQAVNVQDLSAVALKAVPWAFFVGSLRFATTSLTTHANLVSKIYFPREVLPLSSVLAQLVDLALAGAMLAVFLVIAHIGLSIQLLWLPLLLAAFILFTAALSLLLACANLFFRDVKYIVELFLTFGIFFTPVFYEAHQLQQWSSLILLNPIAPLLEGIHNVVVLHRPPDAFWVAYSVCCASLGFWIACLIFDRSEYAFAENL